MIYSAIWKPWLLAAFVLLSQFIPTISQEFLYIPWVVPPTDADLYPDQIARVGDTVGFQWDAEENHSVYIHPSNGCSRRNRKTVGFFNGQYYDYTFTEEDVGTVTFACGVMRHCQFGQIVKFTVLSKAPSSSPSVSLEPSVSDGPSVKPSSSAPTKTPTIVPTASPTIVPSEAPTKTSMEAPSKGNDNIFNDGNGPGAESASDGVYHFGARLAFAMCMVILSIHII